MSASEQAASESVVRTRMGVVSYLAPRESLVGEEAVARLEEAVEDHVTLRGNVETLEEFLQYRDYGESISKLAKPAKATETSASV